jgi:hypothetical protein|tara:strand:- start:1331 stop:2551 length:1221 start_codon:yes stop_codon:yes gene_type:complete
MPYLDPPFRKESSTVLGEGPARTTNIDAVIKGYGEPGPGQFFYELEPAEVISVYLDGNHEDFPKLPDGKPNWNHYGNIEARLVYSNEGDDDTNIFSPLDTNIKEYPRPGEYVIIATYFENSYYTQKVNLFNSINLNSFPGLSKLDSPTLPEKYKYNIKEFKGNLSIREIQSYEGDITFNGRFGQSIRFGSNITQLEDKDGNLLPDSGEPQSPNIKIRAGQGIFSRIQGRPIIEDINLDDSSVYLTTNEVVPLRHYASKITDLDPKKFDGKQITLNSDRVVFNSKGTDIFAYSSRDINLVSKNRIVLEGHKNVYLGDAPKQGETTGWGSDNSNIQPVLRGDQTMILFNDLLKVLIDFAKTIGGAKGTVVDFIVPISDIIEGASGLKGALLELQTRLDEPKSDIVKTN